VDGIDEEDVAGAGDGGVEGGLEFVVEKGFWSATCSVGDFLGARGRPGCVAR